MTLLAGVVSVVVSDPGVEPERLSGMRLEGIEPKDGVYTLEIGPFPELERDDAVATRLKVRPTADGNFDLDLEVDVEREGRPTLLVRNHTHLNRWASATTFTDGP